MDILRQPELLQEQPSLMRIVAWAKTAFNISAHRGVSAKIRLLGQIAERYSGLKEARSPVRLDETGRDFHQRGFAGAVAADDADAVSFPQLQIRIRKQGRAAEGQFDILKRKQQASHRAGV